MKPFGHHLLLDLYECKEGVCDDLVLANQFLVEVVEFIGMTALSDPMVIRADQDKYPDLVGFSGWIPLIESAIMIHAISSTRFISLDVYSCKKFDVEKTIEFCKKYFEPQKIDQSFVIRGKDYAV